MVQNPFLSLEEKLDEIKAAIDVIKKNSIAEANQRNRIVGLEAFSKHTGIPKPTIYAKVLLDKIPGAVKEGKKWVFDIDIYEESLRAKMVKGHGRQ